ncbi:hypothetical protein FI667_g6832, partial [Globisporangium splendens]
MATLTTALHGRKLGGPWDDVACVSDADFVKFCNCRVPKTTENRAIAQSSGRSAGNHTVPAHYNAEDYFAMFVTGLLIAPLGIALDPVLWLLTLPCFVAMKLYLACFPKPLKMVPRRCGFYAFSVMLWLFALPALLIVTVYWVYLALVIVMASLLFSIVTYRIARVVSNWRVLREMRQWPGWTWNDIVMSLMGAMYRQRLGEFLFYFPAVVVVVPVIKYLFSCNPLIHQLSSKYINQWTVPLGVNDESALASAVQAISWTAHVEKDRKDIDDDRFAAHYPLPPAGRKPPSAIGVQFTDSIVNLTKTTHNVEGTIMRSQSGKRDIFVVELFFWNPCHMVTGYVEVNVQVGGAIEHPSTLLFFAGWWTPSEWILTMLCTNHVVWCIMGENYWGNRFYKNVDYLFWNYAPEASEYFQAHGDAGIAK